MNKLLAISKADWRKEADSIAEFFKIFGKDLPKQLTHELHALKKRLS